MVFGNPGQPGFPPFYPNFCQKLKIFFHVLRWTIWQLGNQTIVFLSPIYFHFILVLLPSTILYSLSCFPLHLPPFFIFWRLTLSSHSPSASFHFYHDCKIFPRRSSANLFVRNLWQINSVRHALFSCRDKSSVGKIYF